MPAGYGFSMSIRIPKRNDRSLPSFQKQVQSCHLESTRKPEGQKYHNTEWAGNIGSCGYVLGCRKGGDGHIRDFEAQGVK